MTQPLHNIFIRQMELIKPIFSLALSLHCRGNTHTDCIPLCPSFRQWKLSKANSNFAACLE